MLGTIPVFGVDFFAHRFKTGNMSPRARSIAVMIIFHGSRAAGPETLFIDVELFAFYPSKEHGTNTTIAQWQGLLFPFHRGLVIP